MNKILVCLSATVDLLYNNNNNNNNKNNNSNKNITTNKSVKEIFHKWNYNWNRWK